jgi:hypothetical protein
MRTLHGALASALAVATAGSVLVLTSRTVWSQSRVPTITGVGGQPWLNPDPPCFDNAKRYVDCGNGTVTDTVTGLIWLRDAGCLGSLNWAAANQAAASLQDGQCGLTDRSKPGDWRLPTNAEWRATVDAARNHPLLSCRDPVLTNDDGSACFWDGSGSSFSNVLPTGGLGFWSSTTHSQSVFARPDGRKAGVMPLSDGFLLTFFDKGCCPQRVWPVRAR